MPALLKTKGVILVFAVLVVASLRWHACNAYDGLGVRGVLFLGEEEGGWWVGVGVKHASRVCVCVGGRERRGGGNAGFVL